MKRRLKTFIVALGISSAAVVPPYPHAAAADDPKARQIMEKVNARDDGDNSIADMRMLLIDKHGKERTRHLRSFGKDYGEDTYKLMFFIAPPDVKDTGFLTYDYDNPAKSDDQWLYLPALRKTKRIANEDKSGSFMGSDFNYYDMTKRELEKYEFKLLKEQEVDGVMTWLIQSTPRTKEVVDESGYEKSVVFVRQDNYVVIRAVHWVYGSSRLKYMEVVRLERIEGVWTSTEIHMTTRQGKVTLHKTILTQDNVRYNQGLEDGMFTVRRLEKGL